LERNEGVKANPARKPVRFCPQTFCFKVRETEKSSKLKFSHPATNLLSYEKSKAAADL
jgi:hypothetical protein